MVDYKVRPALSVKAVLDYCDAKKKSIPYEYEKFKLNDDLAPISAHARNRLIESIAIDSDSNNVYYDLIPYLEDSWVNKFESKLTHCQTQAEALQGFYNFYQGSVANLDWHLVEQPDTLCLVAKRNRKHGVSLYDDLTLFTFISKLLHQSNFSIGRGITVKLSSERRVYKHYLDMFNNVSFDNGDLSITVCKTELEIKSKRSFKESPKDIDIKVQIIAASNMINYEELSLESLSFVLGMSPRLLQRTLKMNDLYVKNIIKEVRFKHAFNILIKNGFNLKVTALECGYKDQGQLSHLFTSTTGHSPSSYIALYHKGAIKGNELCLLK